MAIHLNHHHHRFLNTNSSLSISRCAFSKSFQSKFKPPAFFKSGLLFRKSLHLKNAASLNVKNSKFRKNEISSSLIEFSSDLFTDISFYEHPEVPFSSYIAEKERVFDAFFPDKKRSKRINDEIWQIRMLPLSFFFLTVRPIVDMRIWSSQENIVTTENISIQHSHESPTKAAKDVKTRLNLQAVQWELKGVDYDPNKFFLGLVGELYSEKRKYGNSKLKGRLNLSVSLEAPQSLILIPKESIISIGNALLFQLLGSMKEKINDRVLKDYALFTREKLREAKVTAR